MRSQRLMLLVLGTLTVFLVLGTLAVEAAVVGVPVKGQGAAKGHVLVKGQDPVKGQVSVKGQKPVKGQDPAKDLVFSKAGSCPEVFIRCAMLNPPNRCQSDTECPDIKKCCVGSCGMACLNPL
ncbi:PREDICTED: elafin [Chrysochloris asiatica]|uniref:Elafin n=1 Tax=Chrysochloris asiatica TaxID=185453 RepID=A0A9B0T4F6_CHRAS|nr:PREDICTED: elafin [Chrysochloris asiatica]